MTQSPLTNETIHAQIVGMASRDAAFRASLLQNPKEVIEATFGISLPAGMKVQAVEAPADTAVLALPPLAVAADGGDGALDDADLEQVAGGAAMWRWPTQSSLPPGVIPFIAEPCTFGGPASGLIGGDHGRPPTH